MTPRSPTWGDVESFVIADGWRRVPASKRGGRQQRHVFYEKVLPDGRLLQTHVSHSRGKTMSPGRFHSVLREQLEVSKAQFWNAIDSGEPVERPVDLDEAEKRTEHPAWVVHVLVGELHMSVDEIGQLSEGEAKERVYEHWSRQR